MAKVAPPATVDGPAVEPLRYGLFSVATMPEMPNNRWTAGVTWESEVPCEHATAYGSDCESPAGVPLTFREGQDVVEALPFQAKGSYRCKTFSKPADEAQARALNHLLGWEERQVERAIMHGDLGNTPSFQGAVILNGGVSTTPENALNILEEWLGQNVPGIGVLHVPRALAGAYGMGMSAKAGFSRQGSHLETMLGTLVAMGAGYDIDNVSPSGVKPAPGERWVYASARPVVRRSEVFFTPGEDNRVNTDDNDLTVAAHRTYVVGWDCTVAAVLVDSASTESP